MERGDMVVGVDAGATSTRVAVHALDGGRLGYGTAGGGNPSAHGAQAASAAIGAALTRALEGLDPSRVSRSVAGVAGNSLTFGAVLDKLWADHGLPLGPLLMNDVPIAYAAGSAEPSGTLLLSGTGAVAARFTARALDEMSDGLGWLLGDAGSGFWIGRAAAKAVVHALDRGEPGGLLSDLVVAHFLGDDRGPTPRREAERIVRLAMADRTTLGPLAGMVSRAAAEGDPMASEIAERAAAPPGRHGGQGLRRRPDRAGGLGPDQRGAGTAGRTEAAGAAVGGEGRRRARRRGSGRLAGGARPAARGGGGAAASRLHRLISP
ncbi:N-acetylglucosamine kinase [Nonomuraea dietziae]|uniref:N-acetylglucosamine kinase n=1 Tax=Nonomuraea dietziae TaxID=65515 RepID=UPI0031DDBF8D